MSHITRPSSRERLRGFVNRTRSLFKSSRMEKNDGNHTRPSSSDSEEKTDNMVTEHKTTPPPHSVDAEDDWTLCDSSVDDSTWLPNSPIFSDDEVSEPNCEWVCLSHDCIADDESKEPESDTDQLQAGQQSISCRISLALFPTSVKL